MKSKRGDVLPPRTRVVGFEVVKSWLSEAQMCSDVCGDSWHSGTSWIHRADLLLLPPSHNDEVMTPPRTSWASGSSSSYSSSSYGTGCDVSMLSLMLRRQQEAAAAAKAKAPASAAFPGVASRVASGVASGVAVASPAVPIRLPPKGTRYSREDPTGRPPRVVYLGDHVVTTNNEGVKNQRIFRVARTGLIR